MRDASPLPDLDKTQLTLDLVREATGEDRFYLPSNFVIELAVATDTLLWAEDIGDISPVWDAIHGDPSAAVEFREMLVRRRRWAVEYPVMMALFRRRLIEGYRNLLRHLPDTLSDMGGEDAPFTVPLSSLLEEPAEAIEQLMLAAYDDEVFRLDVFKKLRARFAANITIASGFPPDTDPNTVAAKLVMPTRHRSDDAAELAELYLGGTPFENVLDLSIPLEIPDDIRFEHCHIVGGTGHGKTQLLQKLIHADLVAAQRDWRSVVVIDSQGDLIQKLIRLEQFDPQADYSLANRLVLIDPADVEHPPSLNLFNVQAERLDGYRPADRERALNGIIELYETFFGELLGAELTQKQGVIFRYLARLMLVIPDATIHTLMQLMEDSRLFKEHMRKLDGSARYFFETEFNHPSFSATKKQILKRLWGVLSTPAFERMFAQRDNKLDLFEAMKDGKIILINTAKDLLKTEGSALFGRFFIAMIAQATLERSVLPPRERTPTFLYVDEAQEYFDDTVETILTQARKYNVSIAAAHQSLDQLTPRLRSAFLSNTSFKCVGGVSSKDARALASELHTTPEHIEGMRKRRDRTEFAAWIKHRTPTALRMDVPLGYLERQPTLSEEALDEVLDRNRDRYCGTRWDVLEFPSAKVAEPEPEAMPKTTGEANSLPDDTPTARMAEPQPRPRPPAEDRPLGKGGPKHRYLQSLIKELGEQRSFRATIEAPVEGIGQVDVLLERDDIKVAFEVSVSTPIEQEKSNLRKCLDQPFNRVAVVLAKSKTTQGRYRIALMEGLSDEDRSRLSILAPEDLPDYIAALAPAPAPTESMVRGYRVRVSHTSVSPEEAKERRDRLAKLVARSLRDAE